MLFDSIPTYNRYRTLRLLNPQQQGEDVFALQTALNEAGFPCGEPDGILGPMTDKAIKQAQVKGFLDYVMANQADIAETAQIVPMTEEQLTKAQGELKSAESGT